MTTPSQTVGPFFAIGLEPIVPPAGVRIGGRVLDGAGDPIADALVETWDGTSFGRYPTDDDGAWAGIVAPEGGRSIAVHVFARGLLRHLTTVICFDEAAIPESVPRARRDTLLAEPTDDGYRFDIRIQAQAPEHETVFFDL